MTKKDYERAVRIFRAHRHDPGFTEARAHIIAFACELFAEDNPRFNSARFVEAIFAP